MCLFTRDMGVKKKNLSDYVVVENNGTVDEKPGFGKENYPEPIAKNWSKMLICNCDVCASTNTLKIPVSVTVHSNTCTHTLTHVLIEL